MVSVASNPLPGCNGDMPRTTRSRQQSGGPRIGFQQKPPFGAQTRQLKMASASVSNTMPTSHAWVSRKPPRRSIAMDPLTEGSESPTYNSDSENHQPPPTLQLRSQSKSLPAVSLQEKVVNNIGISRGRNPEKIAETSSDSNMVVRSTTAVNINNRSDTPAQLVQQPPTLPARNVARSTAAQQKVLQQSSSRSNTSNNYKTDLKVGAGSSNTGAISPRVLRPRNTPSVTPKRLSSKSMHNADESKIVSTPNLKQLTRDSCG